LIKSSCTGAPIRELSEPSSPQEYSAAALALKTYAGGAACVGAGFGVGVGRGAAEVVAAGAVVGCAFGRPDDEAEGRCVVFVAVGASWGVAD
jgi:hypothetical protein